MTGIFWTTLCLVFTRPIISANENGINHKRQLYNMATMHFCRHDLFVLYAVTIIIPNDWYILKRKRL